jgi:16S rRNA (guanine527-N7)-methyltransferase
VDNGVDGPRSWPVRSLPALGRREGNAVHEGLGETRPRTGWIAEDRTIIAVGARRVDAGSGAALRGTQAKEAYRLDRRREPLPTRVQETRELPAAYDAALRSGLEDLRLELPEASRAAIDGHVRLLLAWTRAINLTAIRDPAAVAIGHVVDSLTALDWLRAHGIDRLLDLGSGGGFPGLPLAAAEPTLAVTLLEPVAKKARFLETVVEATDLAGRVGVIAARAEELAHDPDQRGRGTAVTARAVAPMADLTELAFPLLAPGRALLAWKRGDLTAELAAAQRAIDALGGGSIEVVGSRVGGLPDHRLVVATRAPAGRVPDRYPRDPAARRRQPL